MNYLKTENEIIALAKTENFCNDDACTFISLIEDLKKCAAIFPSSLAYVLRDASSKCLQHPDVIKIVGDFTNLFLETYSAVSFDKGDFFSSNKKLAAVVYAHRIRYPDLWSDKPLNHVDRLFVLDIAKEGLRKEYIIKFLNLVGLDDEKIGRIFRRAERNLMSIIRQNDGEFASAILESPSLLRAALELESSSRYIMTNNQLLDLDKKTLSAANYLPLYKFIRVMIESCEESIEKDKLNQLKSKLIYATIKMAAKPGFVKSGALSEIIYSILLNDDDKLTLKMAFLAIHALNYSSKAIESIQESSIAKLIAESDEKELLGAIRFATKTSGNPYALVRKLSLKLSKETETLLRKEAIKTDFGL